MGILNGIILKGSDEVHKLDYNKALANLPELVKSWNDLEDKPFYVEDGGEVDILPKQDVAFTEDGGMYGTQMSFEIEPNTNYVVEWDGTTYNLTSNELYTEQINESLFINQIMLGNLHVMAPDEFEDTGEPFSIVYVYFSDGSSEYTMIIATDTELSHNIRIYQSGETIHYLDSKFIKDMYSSKEAEVDLLAKQDLTFSNYGASDSGYYIAMVDPTPFTPITDGKYLVEWDGTAYECVGIHVPQLGLTVIGNLYIYATSLTNTGEPFLISTQEGALGIITDETGTTHNISIRQITEIVHQIPSKYVDGYSKKEIDTMLGTYIDEVDALLGGAE